MGTLLRSMTLRVYGLALLTVGLAVVLTLVGEPLSQEIPLLFFFVAVLLSAWYGGLGPGLLATLISAAVLTSGFLAPFLPRPILMHLHGHPHRGEHPAIVGVAPHPTPFQLEDVFE